MDTTTMTAVAEERFSKFEENYISDYAAIHSRKRKYNKRKTNWRMA
jgi:hypothetical protein